VPSLMLKTKDNVVHVGLSQLLELLKDIHSTEEDFKTSLNNNSLTVPDHTEITTVTEVLWIMPSLTLETTVSHNKLNTDIPPEKELAKKIAEITKSLGSLMSQVETVTNLLTPSNQRLLLSLLMLQISNSTVVVSSTIVVLD